MPHNAKLSESIVLESSTTVKDTYKRTSFRGFASIDQEMEREIAMTWFSRSDKPVNSFKSGYFKYR